jgi:hypothetical protein
MIEQGPKCETGSVEAAASTNMSQALKECCAHNPRTIQEPWMMSSLSVTNSLGPDCSVKNVDYSQEQGDEKRLYCVNFCASIPFMFSPTFRSKKRRVLSAMKKEYVPACRVCSI